MPSITPLPDLLDQIKRDGLTTGPIPGTGAPSWLVASWLVVDELSPPSWLVTDDAPPSWLVAGSAIGDVRQVEIPDDLIGWTDLISRFNYKPGWEFLADEDGGDGSTHVLFSFWVDDSRGSALRVRIVYYSALPQWTDARSAVQALVDVIEAAEAHEIAEWFSIDGKAPFGPHA